MEFQPDKEVLIKLVTMRMPFGKYKGTLLCDLPEPYLVWYDNKGFPKGKLGEYLANVLVIKTNGLDVIFYKLKKMIPSDYQYGKKNLKRDDSREK